MPTIGHMLDGDTLRALKAKLPPEEMFTPVRTTYARRTDTRTMTAIGPQPLHSSPIVREGVRVAPRRRTFARHLASDDVPDLWQQRGQSGDDVPAVVREYTSKESA